MLSYPSSKFLSVMKFTPYYLILSRLTKNNKYLVVFVKCDFPSTMKSTCRLANIAGVFIKFSHELKYSPRKVCVTRRKILI